MARANATRFSGQTLTGVFRQSLSRYFPAYQLFDRLPTPVATLRRACAIGRNAGLRYVYEGNMPGEDGENTYCYRCDALLIECYGFFVRPNRIRAGACPDCETVIDGVGLSGD